MIDSKTIFSFPSFTASREEKAKPEYGLAYAKAIWAEYVNNSALYNSRRERDIQNRKYAEGLESIDKYKDRLDLNGDTSFLNLDFSPVNRIASLVDNIVGKMMNQEYKIICNPIDPESKTKFDDYRDELRANMFLKPYSDEVEKMTGIPLIPKGKSIPETDEEMELDLKLKYKPAASIAMEKAIKFVFMNNDAEDIRRKILRDLVVLKRAATYRYYDENKNIRYEYVDPVDLLTPYSKDEKFKNIEYVAVVKYYNIFQIAQMNPDFTEEQLFYIAKSQAGQNKNPNWSFSNSYQGYYVNDSIFGSRPYNNFTIQVLEFYYLTINREVRVKKANSKGGYFFEKKSDKYTGEIAPESLAVQDFDTKWVLKGEKGMEVGKAVAKTKEEAQAYFAKVKNDKKNANTEKVERQIQYKYEGKWIPQTEFIFNYKMCEYIERDNISGSYSPKTELPIVIIAPDIYDMENKSLVERMIPHEDQINLIHLKSQQLLIKAKPPGVAIDLEGMDMIVGGMGDAKNAKMDPIEITRMYEQTGSYTFRSKDKDGNFINGRVIDPLENGIGRDFMTLFAAYNQELQKMNDVIGYNTAVDASSPDTKALVGVNKMAVSATNNALRPLYQHSIDLITRQAQRIALMIQDSISLNNEAFIMAIGAYATETLDYGKKIAFNQFAINIELLPDEEEKMQIEQLIQLGLQGGTLMTSDAIRIRQVLKEDVKLGAQLMVLLEEKNRKNKMEEQKALVEQNGQVQIQSGQAVAQANAQAEMQINASKAQLLELEYNLKSKLSAQEHTQTMEQIGGKNQGAEVVAVINSHAKENVQEAINEGKKEVAEMTHDGKILEKAFERATEPKE